MAGVMAGQVTFPRWATQGEFADCPDLPVDKDEMLGFLDMAAEQSPSYFQRLLIGALRDDVEAL